MAIENLKKHMISVVFTFYIAFWLDIASKKQGCCPWIPFLPWLPLRDATKTTTLQTALSLCQRLSAGADATGVARAHGLRECRYWAPLLCSFTSPLTSPRLRAISEEKTICCCCGSDLRWLLLLPPASCDLLRLFFSFFLFLRHRFGGSPLLWPRCGGPSSSVLLSPGASQVHQGHGGVCCCRFAQQTNNWITGFVVVVLLWQGRRGLFGLDFVGVCRFLAGV